jgi:hypothetical protein
VVTNYHLLDSGNGPRLVPVPRTLERVPAIGGATLRALLGGPSGRESKAGIVSMIPTGAILLGLSIQDGVATVDLSSEFAGGGSETDVQARVAQVLYSLTQFSTVKRVAFELDGQPTAVPTGNGETVERPVARDDYLELLPPVFVETPRWGETVTHPLRISGVANVFEARFFVELRDANDSLARQAVMATCGSGCWGTFEATIPYASAIAQPGTLMTYTVSQGGPGGPTDDERSYGVELTAGG